MKLPKAIRKIYKSPIRFKYFIILLYHWYRRGGIRYVISPAYRIKFKTLKNNIRKRIRYGSAFNTPRIHQSRVSRLLERDGPNCQGCKKLLRSDITIDHIDNTVNEKGRLNHALENLQLMHWKCNCDKGKRAQKEKILRERKKVVNN